MRIVAVILGVCACGARPRRDSAPPHDLDVDAKPPAPEPPSKPAVDCAALIREGTKKHDARDYEAALAIYKQAQPSCDRGHGLHNEIGYTLAAQNRFDEAAVEYIIELRGPNPGPTAFGNLQVILPQLSASRRAEIARIGSSDTEPLHVPDIGYEYAWIARFACVDGEGKTKSQALVEAGGRRLDAISYTCPADASERTAYFDFAADPATRAFERELEQQP